MSADPWATITPGLIRPVDLTPAPQPDPAAPLAIADDGPDPDDIWM